VGRRGTGAVVVAICLSGALAGCTGRSFPPCAPAPRASLTSLTTAGRVRWRHDVSDGSGTMVVLGSTAVVPSTGGVIGVDATTGAVRWRWSAGGLARLLGALGGRAVIESSDHLVALDAGGSERWHLPVSGSDLVLSGRWLSRPDEHELLALDPRTGAPTAHLSWIAAFAVDGDGATVARGWSVARIDPQGRTVWSAQLATDHFHRGVTSIDEVGSTVLAISASDATGDERVVSLDARSGRARFAVDGIADAGLYASALISDRWRGTPVAGVFTRHVEIRDPVTGRVRGTAEAPAGDVLGGIVAVGGDDAVFSRGRGFVHVSLDRGPSHGVSLGGSVRSAVVAATAAGLLVTGGDDVERVALVDPHTAEIHWSFEASEPVEAVAPVGSGWLVHAANPLVGCA